MSSNRTPAPDRPATTPVPNHPKRRRIRRPALTVNVPNILTVLRILVTPLFVILMLREMHGPALLVFVLAGVSDGLDGLIARMFNQRSDLGAVLDPIADKLLLSAAYVSLGILGTIPAWVVVVVISRDVLIVTGIAVLSFCKVEFDIRPSLLSKWTTAVQLLTVGVALLQFHFPAALALRTLCWATVAMSVLSGLHYTYVGLNTLQTGFEARSRREDE
jgi:cardiolipin synthase